MGSCTWVQRRGLLKFWLWGSEQGKDLVGVHYCWLISIRAVLQRPQCHSTVVE